jgi:hypothetical protein
VTTATNANNINIQDYTTGGGNFYLPFAVGTGLNAIGIDTSLVYNGTTNTLTIPNLTVSGTLTATVTSTTASNIVVTDNSTTNTNYLPLFTTAAGSSQAASIDTGFTYNPNTNTLTATNITATGTLSGTFGGTIANATNAINTGITAVTTGTIYYPTFVSATTGNNPQLVDTDLQFNSATNTLTCPTFSGNIIATTLTPNFTYPLGAGKIGQIISPTITWSRFGDGVICTQSLSAGVWILNVSISLNGTPINNFIYPKNSLTPDALYYRIPFISTGLTNNTTATGSWPINMTSAGTFYLYNCLANNQSIDFYDISVIRVA